MPEGVHIFLRVAVQTSAGSYHVVTVPPDNTGTTRGIVAQCIANGTNWGGAIEEALWSAQPTIWNATGTRRIYFFFQSLQ